MFSFLLMLYEFDYWCWSRLWYSFGIHSIFVRSSNCSSLSYISNPMMITNRFWVKYYSGNPFVDHMKMMIRFHFVPYRNIDDVIDNRIDYPTFYQIIVYNIILVINMVRFMVLIIWFGDYPLVKQCFIEFMPYQPNQYFLNLTAFLIFSTTSIFCKIFFVAMFDF